MSLLYHIPAISNELQFREAIRGTEIERSIGPTIACRGATRGPSGAGGIYAVRGAEVNGLGYYPESQTWRSILGGKIWIGRINDKPITPDQLKRTPYYGGHPVTLSDGQPWTIPVARHLPSILSLDDATGKWQQVLAPQFRAFCDAAAEVWEACDLFARQNIARSENKDLTLSDREKELASKWDDVGRFSDFCCEAMALNYHVTRHEVGLLGLLDTKNIFEIVDAVRDGPSLRRMIEALSKKKEIPDSPNSSNGEEVCITEPTSQPSQIMS